MNKKIFPISLSSLKMRVLLIVCIITYPHAGQLLDRANSLYGDGKLKEAINTYNKAALSGENPALCHFNAANAYYQLDQLPQSIVHYKISISYAPSFFKAYLNLAAVYFTLNDLGACIATMNSGLRIEPTDQKGLLIYATACRKAGAIPEAALTFEKIAGLYPEIDEPFISLGEIYKETGDYETAEIWLKSSPESGVHLGYIYTLLADIKQFQGDTSKMIFYLERAFAVDNTQKWTLYRIVQLHEIMGNELVAFEMAKDGMSQFPDFPDLSLLAGNIAFKRLRLEEAELCYNAALKYGSSDAVIGLQNVRIARKSAAGLN
jgi:tetratricopeptide (TPR) repeat protein